MIAPDLALTLSLTLGLSSSVNPGLPAGLIHGVSSTAHGRPTGSGLGGALPSPQVAEVVARFQMGEKTYQISRNEVSLNLVRRTRNSASTKAAIEHLIDVEMVRQAANSAGLMPSTAEVDAELSRVETQVKLSQLNFDKILAAQHMTRQDMSDLLALKIAKRRLAGKALRRPPAEVTNKHLNLWSKQQRGRVTVITDPKLLTSGVVATVANHEITDLDLGRVLFIKIKPASLSRTVQEMVFMRMIAFEANCQDIKLSKKDFERQFERTRVKFERSARSQGVSYEKWLVALGGSKQKEIDSPTMRSILQHEQLVRRRYSPTRLDDMLAKNGAALHRRHGTRRSLSIIFLRATKNPNKIVKRTFAATAEYAGLLREAIIKEKKTFAMVARTSSDDPKSKVAGGKIGWQHREYLPNARNQRAPAEVLATAFDLKIGQTSRPIKTADGYYLVWVSGIESTPEKPTMHRRILGELSDGYSRELIASAKIEMVIK